MVIVPDGTDVLNRCLISVRKYLRSRSRLKKDERELHVCIAPNVGKSKDKEDHQGRGFWIGQAPPGPRWEVALHK
jgi:hypothetical protein